MSSIQMVRANACSDHGLIDCGPCEVETTRQLSRRGLAQKVWEITSGSDDVRPTSEVLLAP